jgi:DNA polymerase-3 subunit epsilon
MYAVVDIETTGGNAGNGSITEIAILITDGEEILDRYTTLVNPMRPIPLFVEKLTGITDAMVSSAPIFADVAREVYDLLQGKVFVAHNVNFDFSFISHQLQQHGYRLQSRKLCTVRLSRKIFQNLPSYSLGNLCRSLEIKLTNRHRAMGDAEATTLLFHQLLRNDSGNHIQSMLRKGSKEAYLPMHLSGKDLDKMPNTPGIYYFHDNKGKVIYVGKAKQLKKRVISHFSNNDVSKRKQELIRLVHKISYKECGNELMMSVQESIEIKRIWPLFNRSQKKFENRFGICSFEDQKGILRLGVVKKKKHIRTHTTFALQLDGIRLLQKIAREHGLCPKMCFLQQEFVPCSGMEESYCTGICDNGENVTLYNNRVIGAIDAMIRESPALAVFGPGRKISELSCIMIGRNDILATGFVTHHALKMKKEKLEKQLTPAASNEFIRSLVMGYAEKNPALTVIFE